MVTVYSYRNSRTSTVDSAALSLDSARAHLVDYDLVARMIHFFARGKLHIFVDPVATLVDLCRYAFGAHVQQTGDLRRSKLALIFLLMYDGNIGRLSYH